jgi:hypothetical protein
MAYTPTTWVNDTTPALNATNLNNLETGVDTAHDAIDNHLADTADAHDASAISFSATGPIASTDAQSAVAEVATRVTLNAQTGTTYTFVLSDAGKLVTRSNASANTSTIPPNSSVAFPTGTVLNVAQTGAGTASWVAGAGVTINSRGALLGSAGQYAFSSAIKTATDTWLLTGDLA